MEIQQIARQAVEASAVLLKNQDMLPLAPGKQVGLFRLGPVGPGALRQRLGGFPQRAQTPALWSPAVRRGWRLVPALADFYKQWVEQEKATKAPAMELPQLKEACQQRLDVRALWQVQSQPPGTRHPPGAAGGGRHPDRHRPVGAGPALRR